jgi:hypothetical protein
MDITIDATKRASRGSVTPTAVVPDTLFSQEA